MKKKITLLLFCLATLIVNAQVLLLQETFQDWKSEAGIAPVPPSTSPSGVEYTFTKKLLDGKTDGTFTSNSIIVAPTQSIGTSGAAEGNGNPSRGRIAMKGAKTYLELPKLPSIGVVNIKASVGTDLKEFKLQASTGGAFEDIPGTVTACSKAVTKLYTFNFTYSTPTTLRIVPTSGSGVYIWDLEIFSYSTPKR
jgi:hypothetical protein